MLCNDRLGLLLNGIEGGGARLVGGVLGLLPGIIRKLQENPPTVEALRALAAV